jgi:ubiquinone/menaquinone biosynthesis C-methylase UbiE
LNQLNHKDIVRNNYLKYLHREPDEHGWNYYVRLMDAQKINENKLIEIFKNSFEYKLSHPVKIEFDTSVDIRMKKEWNERTKINPFFVIATNNFKSEENFWESGIFDCKNILGIDTQRFKKILENNDASKMSILEIGCGIGRILIPMKKFFGNVIGIDVSSEMVQLGQKNIKDIPNCVIIENNGIDLSEFQNDSFDFCYSFIVFQHIPEKKVVENYIKEVSRVLKPECLFRFQVRGIISTKPSEITTWDGVQFTSDEIHKIAKENNFEIMEEGDDDDEYYWLTFKLNK